MRMRVDAQHRVAGALQRQRLRLGGVASVGARLKLSAPGTTLTAGCASALPLPASATSGGLVPEMRPAAWPCAARRRRAGRRARACSSHPAPATQSTAQVPPLPSEKSAAWAPASVNCCSVTAPGPWLRSVSERVAGRRADARVAEVERSRRRHPGQHRRGDDAGAAQAHLVGRAGGIRGHAEAAASAAPTAAGVNVTDSVQLAPAARLAPQSWQTPKPPSR